MLLRSLIDRLIGSQEVDNELNAYASDSSRLSYARYPGLLDLMYHILAGSSRPHNEDYVAHAPSASATLSTEAYFPILDLLRRAPPAKRDAHRFVDLILNATASPHWHLRVIAAKAYASISDSGDSLVGMLHILLDEIPTESDAQHGILLCAYNVCRKRLLLSEHREQGSDAVDSAAEHKGVWFRDALQLVGSVFFILSERSKCGVLLATCLNIINLVGVELFSARSPDVQACHTYVSIGAKIKSNLLSSHGWTQSGIGDDLLERAQFQAICCTALLQHGQLAQDIHDSDFEQDVPTIMARMSSHILASGVRSMRGVVQKASHRVQLLFLRMLVQLVGSHASLGMLIDSYDTMSEVLERSGTCGDFLLAAKSLLNQVPSTPALWLAGSPSELESKLRLRGYLLGATLMHGSGVNTVTAHDVAHWNIVVASCLDENNVSRS